MYQKGQVLQIVGVGKDRAEKYAKRLSSPDHFRIYQKNPQGSIVRQVRSFALHGVSKVKFGSRMFQKQIALARVRRTMVCRYLRQYGMGKRNAFAFAQRRTNHNLDVFVKYFAFFDVSGQKQCKANSHGQHYHKNYQKNFRNVAFRFVVVGGRRGIFVVGRRNNRLLF